MCALFATILANFVWHSVILIKELSHSLEFWESHPRTDIPFIVHVPNSGWYIMCCVVLCCVVLCCVVLCCVVLCCVVLCCVVMWCDVMWCDVMWCDVMWCDVMWCDVMWCDVMWCLGNSIRPDTAQHNIISHRESDRVILFGQLRDDKTRLQTTLGLRLGFNESKHHRLRRQRDDCSVQTSPHSKSKSRHADCIRRRNAHSPRISYPSGTDPMYTRERGNGMCK